MPLLLEPLQIGTLQLSNRLVMPPMATAKAEADGKVSPALLQYYDEKTKGGFIGLVIIEHSYIHPLGKASNHQLSIADDSVIEPLKKLAAAIHANGSKTIMQINHAGSASSADIIGSTPLGPSAVANPRKGTMPRELSLTEIEAIITDFKNAALRVKKAGFDGVEIHSAHGYLLNQFFSALTNQRADDYGGNLKKRINLHLKIIKAVRSAVGKDFPVFLRLGASDYAVGGITPEDSQEAALDFEKAGVNVLDISGGFCGYTIPGEAAQGYFSPLSQAVKGNISIPVILTGGITDINFAETLLKEGKADLIGVGRSILNDSQWAQHAIETLRQTK